MHPAWIEKLEESRRGAVVTFWAVMVLVVVIPLLLIVKSDFSIILGVACFCLAGFRIYWLNQDEKMAQMRARAENRTASGSVKTTPFPEAPVPSRGVPTNPFAEPIQTINNQLVQNQPAFAYPQGTDPSLIQQQHQMQNPYQQADLANPAFADPAASSSINQTEAPLPGPESYEPPQPARPMHFHDRIANRRPTQSPPVSF